MQFIRDNRYSLLLLALLLLLIGIPLADQFTSGSRPLARTVLFTAMLLIGALSLPQGTNTFRAGMALAVGSIGLNIASHNIPGASLFGSFLLCTLGFMLVTVVNALRDVAFDQRISFDRLIGGICVYLLLGILWALGYTLVEIASPGSFNGIERAMDGSWQSGWLYFSFVTMTTLGYGDISPITPLARLLAYLQATVGMFYIAILVAGLVGAYVSARGLEQDN